MHRCRVGPKRMGLLAVCVLIIFGVITLPARAAVSEKRMQTLPFSDIVLLYYVEGERAKVADFIPYVAYVDAAGTPREWFFDAFLYTANGSVQGTFDWANPLFDPGANLDALHEAIREVAATLGLPPSPRLVYMAMPIMSGSVEERIERNRRYIDTVRALWAEKEYDHLQLGGFYWTHEGIRDPEARATVTWTYDYIRSLDGHQPLEKTELRLLFIPYDFGHPNRPQVYEFGDGALPVDALWLQPNFLWADRERGYDRQDLDEVARFALSQGATVEMEYDPGVLLSGWKTARYYHYLDSGVTYGYMDGPLAYYQSRWGYAEAARNQLSLMRQVYEDTFAFGQGFYRPRSIVHEMPLPVASSPTSQLAVQFRNLGDALLSQGLWLGRRERPDHVTHLRLIEPDPNQSHWLILSFTAPVANDPTAQGILTIETRDGELVEIGRYPLNGTSTTRWFALPTEVLSSGVPGNPKDIRLTYTVRFSDAVEVHGGWLRSQQHLLEWERNNATTWAALDPASFVARQGLTLPGIVWDEVSTTLRWFGLDAVRTYTVGIETEGRTLTRTITSQEMDANGAGSRALSELVPGERVMRVWAHPSDAPFYTAFGVQGDTAFTVKRPGISVIPSSGWQFVGAPVGVSRRLAGQGSLQVDVPADGRGYVARIRTRDAASLTWELRQLPGKEVVASGSTSGRLLEVEIDRPGTFELQLNGTASLIEAWLISVER